MMWYEQEIIIQKILFPLKLLHVLRVLSNFGFIIVIVIIISSINNYSMMFVSYLQNMNTSGFRTCVKELYETRYDPVSVSYAVVTG